MQERTCVQCGAQFQGRSNATLCGAECRKQRRCEQTREWTKRTGYHAKHRAKPEVKAKRQQRERLHGRAYRQAAKVPSTCVVCGTEWMADCKAKSRPVSYCSGACRSFGLHGPKSTPVPDTHPSRSTPVPKTHGARKRKDPRPRFLAGRCAHCGAWFVADRLAFSSHADRSCSHRCTRRLAEAKRRATERGAYVEQVDRFEIFQRDGWMCMLCGDPLHRDEVAPHPWSPSIDHVIPLARGGTHERANVQAAHFWCNSVKGDRTSPVEIGA